MSLKDEYLKESEIYDIFEYLKLELWSAMYTKEDIDETFDNKCTVLHYNQELESVSPLKITPISSGHHLGSWNWVIHHNVFDKKIGILQQSCIHNEYRYPLEMNIKALNNCDILFIGSMVNENNLPSKNGDDTYSYNEAIKQLYEYLKMNSQSGQKVLLPMNPFLILEILEVLTHSISPRLVVRIFSESAEGIKAFSNLNLDYLNTKLQDKILGKFPILYSLVFFDLLILWIIDSLNPFDFDKLKKDNKFEIFTDQTGYMYATKPNEDPPELILATSSSLRMGDAVFWMYQLNKKQIDNEASCSILLTDPQFQSSFVTDPFEGSDDVPSEFAIDITHNKLPIVRIPIDPSPTIKQLNALLKKIKPKKVVWPSRYWESQGSDSESSHSEVKLKGTAYS